MTCGLGARAAAQTRRRDTLKVASFSWMNSRHTVGGAQSVVTPQLPMAASNPLASKRGWLTTNTVAPAFQGAKKPRHACLAQPGDATHLCVSPAATPCH